MITWAGVLARSVDRMHFLSVSLCGESFIKTVTETVLKVMLWSSTVEKIIFMSIKHISFKFNL